jgi:ferric-dicitrate binding protein FerR (iron transport regulator)
MCDLKNEIGCMETPYVLIIKFLEDIATSEEIEALMEWRQASSRNEQLFNEWLRTWNRNLQRDENAVIPSKHKVWRSIQQQLDLSEDERSYSKRNVVQLVALAAGIALFIGFFIAFFAIYHPMVPETLVSVETPAGQKVHVTLPDGSKVWLNAGSTLSYSSNFNHHHERIVTLNGEAYFDVVHHPDRPFVVKTGSLNVKVLGTIFDVQTYKNDVFANVSLIRGKVCVYSEMNHKPIAVLSPNQMLTLNTLNGMSSVTSCNATDQSIWIRNELRFNGISPQEMFKQLGRWYGVTFDVANMPVKNRYWLTLKTESLTEAIQLISKITPLNYTINGEEVHVKFKP